VRPAYEHTRVAHWPCARAKIDGPTSPWPAQRPVRRRHPPARAQRPLAGCAHHEISHGEPATKVVLLRSAEVSKVHTNACRARTHRYRNVWRGGNQAVPSNGAPSHWREVRGVVRIARQDVRGTAQRRFEQQIFRGPKQPHLPPPSARHPTVTATCNLPRGTARQTGFRFAQTVCGEVPFREWSEGMCGLAVASTAPGGYAPRSFLWNVVQNMLVVWAHVLINHFSSSRDGARFSQEAFARPAGAGGA